MKILHLTGENEDAGGVLSVLRNLQAASQKLGDWRFMVWVRDDFTELRAPKLTLMRSRHGCASDESHLRMLMKSYPAYRDVCRLLEKESIDVVHIHSRGTLLVGFWLALRRRMQVVFTNHNFARKHWLYRLATRIPNIHSVLLTPNMAHHYKIGLDRSNVSVISACFADNLLDRPVADTKLKNDCGSKIKLIGLGNIVRWKNWHLVIDALRMLPEQLRTRFEFDHWGPSLSNVESRSYRDELLAAGEDAKLVQQVRFHGMTTEIYENLTQANWFILPSTNEPCSVALMEALACGVPAVVSRSGGSVDIVDDRRTGAFFNPDDSIDLSRVLEAIARGTIQPLNPIQIRESVKCRSATSVMKQYAELYTSVAA